MVKKVLFAQQSHVLDSQREAVLAKLSPLGVKVGFASDPSMISADDTYDTVITPTIPWLGELLERVPDLQWLHLLSAGVEKIWEIDYDWSRITITNSSGVHAAPISEYVLGAILYFAKSFNRFVTQSQNHVWEREWLNELTGQRVLIIGAGAIGRAVAERTQVLGMKPTVLARTPRTDKNLGEVLGLHDLPQAIGEADFIVVAAPLTEQTTGLFNEAVLSSAKKGAYLIDVSRGGIVVESALIGALNSGILGGAALDVFEQEPLPEESLLWNREDVLLTPHVAGTTPHYLNRALDVFLKNVEAQHRGESLPTCVHPERGY